MGRLRQQNLIIQTQQKQMSGKFSNTTTSFGTSNLMRQEQYIREIVQSQVTIIFDDIRTEIEIKIKSIDKNIYDLRREVQMIEKQNRQQSGISEIAQKLQKIEAEMQLLRYQQQVDIRSSRARSLERKPIFKKNSRQEEDFGCLVLDLGIDKNQKSIKKVLDKKQLNKPPMPKDTTFDKSSLSIESVSNRDERISREQSSKAKRNPVLDKSASIHRWLNQNNNSQFSCFNEIIKQEQIQESLYC